MKVGGLKDPWCILYYIGAHFLYPMFLLPNFGLFEIRVQAFRVFHVSRFRVTELKVQSLGFRV